MRTIAIIQARMGSARLPNKVMIPVLGKPLLGWMLGRVACCPEISETVVATTMDVRDDVIAQFTESAGFQVYRGSEDDVLDRYYQAARLMMPDAVARITADCPLMDPEVLGSMVREFESGKADFISNSEPLPSSWPDGMDISIMSFAALEKAWRYAIKPSEREHVTFYFWNNPQEFKCERIEHIPDLSKYRLTIDYPEDFLVIKAIIEHFCLPDPDTLKSVPMKAIIEFLDEHPDMFELNAAYSRGMGWQPSFERDKRLTGLKASETPQR
jgi:spore coat polysaccharide biosynthesis protein SpsF (cytidylyltransferase family)